IKTNPAGWFGYEPDRLASHIILVEGAFDRLTLLAAGLAPENVVALVGTAAHIDWFLPQVKAVVLALDGDEGGTAATRRLTDEFEQAGLYVRRCPPSPDRRGKDWNERWRRIGPPSVWPILETFSALRSA
nr:toprim domain-containing protein [Chloroflexota bacterium]